MVVKGQWVALKVKCGIQFFSFGTLLGHRDTGAEGAREVHTRGALMSTKGDTVFFILTHLGHV